MYIHTHKLKKFVLKKSSWLGRRIKARFANKTHDIFQHFLKRTKNTEDHLEVLHHCSRTRNRL